MLETKTPTVQFVLGKHVSVDRPPDTRETHSNYFGTISVCPVNIHVLDIHTDTDWISVKRHISVYSSIHRLRV